MGTAEIRESIFNGLGMLGIRLVLGAIFIVHGIPKFGDGFVEILTLNEFPLWLQYPVALGEFVPGVLFMAGVLSRMSGAVIAAIMLGIFIVIDQFESLTGENGMEYHLILFAAAILVMVMGPGRISLSSRIKSLPRWLH